MNYTKKTMLLMTAFLTCVAGMVCSSCSKDQELDEWGMFPGDVPGDLPGEGGGEDDGDKPEFDSTIYTWNGEMADDAAKDVVGTDEDIYWEANGFGNTGGVTVSVVYSGNTATVTSTNSSVKFYTEGA